MENLELLKQLLKTLKKYLNNAKAGYVKRGNHDRLVPREQYQTYYDKIKEDSGKHWVSVWPEKTDPSKFVYEDVAIASWLCCLWQSEKYLFELAFILLM